MSFIICFQILILPNENRPLFKIRSYFIIRSNQNTVIKFELAADLTELYELKLVTIEETRMVPSRITIGKWLKDNPDIFFAEPTYSKGEYNTLRNAMLYTTIRLTTLESKSTKLEVNGYDLKIDVPFKGLSIIANSIYPNINSYNFSLIFLLSKKAIRFFYFIASYIEESWDNRKLNGKEIEWKSAEFRITDKASVIDGFKSILAELNDRINKDLIDRFKAK